MERIVEIFLASAESTPAGGSRYTVNLHTDIETLKADGIGAESELEEHSHVSAGTW